MSATESSKRIYPEDNTPPKHAGKKSKSKKKKSKGDNRDNDIVCPVCEKVIVEETENLQGDEAVFCEGACQSWIHRTCIGITKQMYASLGESEDSFFCCYCMIASLQTEISSLKTQVKSLTTELKEIKTLPTVQSEEDSNIMSTAPVHTDALNKIHTQIKEITSSLSNHQKIIEQKDRIDRANNLIVSGISENSEQEETPLIISDLLSSKLGLSNISISQARRLGKHKEAQNKPRPILITLPKSHDRSSVISNRSKLAGSDIYVHKL